MPEKVFKVLAKGQKSCHGGSHTWIPGEWLTVKGKLIPCENGIHLCKPEHLLDWLHEEIWEAEYKGKCIDHGDKIVVRSARIVKQCLNWNDRTARLFACDCAQDVVHLNTDPRVQAAIDVARLFAEGKCSQKDLAAAGAEAGTAAGAAAGAEAWTAAWAAAGAAAGAAAWAAAWTAAGTAARAAAGAAAGAAAWAAAGAKYTGWLMKILEEGYKEG